MTAGAGKGLGPCTLDKAAGRDEQRLARLLPLRHGPPTLHPAWLPAGSPVPGPENGVCTQCVPRVPLPALLSQSLLQA